MNTLHPSKYRHRFNEFVNRVANGETTATAARRTGYTGPSPRTQLRLDAQHANHDAALAVLGAESEVKAREVAAAIVDAAMVARRLREADQAVFKAEAERLRERYAQDFGDCPQVQARRRAEALGVL